ncbi:MAG TPA: hypothetical protein VGQ65_14305 [Thermoanaerobaculia bacterium]|jgi:hypothetical protein|nr:hypothetical protein [Thermoanaerobaculia bacterium]
MKRIEKTTLKSEIEDGAIVAVSTAFGQRMTREELVALAMQKWEHTIIEEALGDDAAAVLRLRVNRSLSHAAR